MGKSKSESKKEKRSNKVKKSHKRDAAAAAQIAESAAPSPKTVEQRVQSLEKQLKNLRQLWALNQASDIIKRFRHHVMYDLTKTYNIELPAKVNPRKRTNWASACQHILASERTPEEWKTALRCLQQIEAGNKFPFGFWDNMDNAAIQTDDVEAFAQTVPDEYRSGILAMTKCSLKCTPPCARGKSNAPNKGQNFSVEDVERIAKEIVEQDD